MVPKIRNTEPEKAAIGSFRHTYDDGKVLAIVMDAGRILPWLLHQRNTLPEAIPEQKRMEAMPTNVIHKQCLPNDPSMKVNNLGHLEFNNCDVVTLAKEYGTPLYVMNEDGIRQNCRSLKTGFMGRFPNTMALYASKAFSNLAMCEIIKEEGLGIDVVSGGELYTAHKAGISMEKVYFHGNNKTEEEMVMALEYGVGRFVVDSFWEIEHLNRVAVDMHKTASVLLRISPGIDAHTHEYLQTGVLDCKFGFPIEGGSAMESVKATIAASNLKFMGIHCHIGSQIFTLQAYEDAATVMMNLVNEIAIVHGEVCQELNLGGGYGIRYTDEDRPLDTVETLEIMYRTVEAYCLQHRLTMPRILVEPGRWIVGENGITLYTIGTQKDVFGVRKYISVDGGMADNPRPSLYQAEYQGVVANRLDAPEVQTVTIAGRCCESGDLLIRDAVLPEVFGGDILAVLSTGAYNYSMSSNYNRLRKPPVLMIRNGIPQVVVKGETYEDLMRNDLSLSDIRGNVAAENTLIKGEEVI